MSPAHSVLLDLDGTLVDSQPGILASCVATLRALGHDPGEALDIKHDTRPWNRTEQVPAGNESRRCLF